MPDFVAEAKALLAVAVDTAQHKEPEKREETEKEEEEDRDEGSHEENTHSALDSRIPSSSSSSPSESDRESDPEDEDEDDKTTLLPSLTMGGYWSGSESEPEDDLPELGGGRNGQPERKNRMGQQARRALWEKKFGKEANHLKKQKQNQKQGQKKGRKRDEGWDLRRGATAPEDRKDRKEKTQRQRPGSIDEHRPKKQKMQDDTPVHPSWEAKRKAREAMAAKMSGFQGKKVVFD
ncbi:hypothetical protein KEM56_005066 [Ascosphaera pollenicola]|nr:hypothetical protein KEM56_005066 [Ascosphaera pollenicola]